MKKFFLFILFVFFLSQLTFAIPQADTPVVAAPKKENNNPVLTKNDTVEIHYVVKNKKLWL
jgi:hypothetical protein